MKKLLLSLLAVAGAWTSAGAVVWVNDVTPTAGGQSFYLCSVQTKYFLGITDNKTVDAKDAKLFTWRSDNRLVTDGHYVKLTTNDVTFPTSQPGNTLGTDNGTFRFVKSSDYYNVGLSGKLMGNSYWLKNKSNYNLENPINSQSDSRWYLISQNQYTNHWSVEAYEKAVAAYNAKDKTGISDESMAWAAKYLDVDNAAEYQTRISEAGLAANEVDPLTELITAWTAEPEKFALLKDTDEQYTVNGKTVTHVDVERTIKAGTWNTLCLPFSMDIPTDWTVKELSGVTYNSVADSYDAQFSTAASIVAGKPYIVKVKAEVTEITRNDAAGFKLAAVPTPVEVSDNGGTLYFGGIFVPMDLAGCYFISGGKFYYAAPGKGNTTKAYRALFTVVGGTSSAKLIYTVDGDEVTLIDAPELVPANDAPIFDLQGRRVNAPVSGKLYVKNGKKFVQQ